MSSLYTKIIELIERFKNNLFIKVLVQIFAIIGLVSSVLGIYQFFNDTDKAIQLHGDAVEYYVSGDYNKVVELEQKAYKINRHIDDVILYYVLGLINTTDEHNLRIAKEILMVNRKVLSEDEKAVYAYLEWLDGNYRKSLEVIDTIERPVYLKPAIFQKYILVYSDASYNIDYNNGRSVFNECSKLITLKKNTLGLFLDNDSIFQLPGNIKVDMDNYLNGDLFCINETSLQLTTTYLKYSEQPVKIEENIAVIRNSSEDFEYFFMYNEEIVRRYLFYFNEVLRVGQEECKENEKFISDIFDNLIVDGSAHRDTIKKLQLLKNIAIDTYDLSLEKEAFEVNEQIEGLAILSLSANENTKSIHFYEGSLIGNQEYDMTSNEFSLFFSEGIYNTELNYTMKPLVISQTGNQYYYRLIPCFFE